MKITVQLPPEIIAEIFVRLPSKAVVRCKILSKDWFGTISDPTFVKRHRTRMRLQNKVHTLIQEENYFMPFQYEPPVDGGPVLRRLVWGFRDFEYLGSCNGLVLLCGGESVFFLLNPTTGMHTFMPPEPINFPAQVNGARTLFGLGYNDRNDDYHILRLSLFHSIIWLSKVKIFSRNSSQWIDLGQHPHESLMSGNGVYANGCLHWRVYSRHLSVFNLEHQQFSLITVPECISQSNLYYKLSSLNNDKVVLSRWLYTPNEPVDVWIMENYHFPNSWTRYEVTLDVPIFIPRYINLQPLYLVEPQRHKIVFWLNPIGTFGYWDLLQGRFFFTDDQPIVNVPFSVFPYVESYE